MEGTFTPSPEEWSTVRHSWGQVEAYERRGLLVGGRTSSDGRDIYANVPRGVEHLEALQRRCKQGKGSDQKRAPKRLAGMERAGKRERMLE